MQATQGDSTKALLIKAINCTREFAIEMIQIVGESIELASETCKDLLFWLYLVCKK